MLATKQQPKLYFKKITIVNFPLEGLLILLRGF
jgi:hypothetical protein